MDGMKKRNMRTLRQVLLCVTPKEGTEALYKPPFPLTAKLHKLNHQRRLNSSPFPSTPWPLGNHMILKHQSSTRTSRPIGSLARSALSVVAGIALTLGQAAAVENSNLRLDSTGDLYAVCSVPASAAEFPVARQACRAFIEGVAQYHDLISKPGKMKRLYCMPKGSTLEDGVDAFNAWAATHTGDAKRMGEEPALGLIRALAAKYPCKG